MYYRVILLLVFAVFFSSTSGAKCGMQKYSIVGRLAVETSLTQSIRIYPFLEGTETTGIIPDGTGKLAQDFVIPNRDGSFTAELWLSTDSGALSFGRDNCTRKAKYVDLFITGDGVRAKRVQVALKWVKGKVPLGDAGVITI